jgi:hypothetical protein
MQETELYCYIDETGQDTSAQADRIPFYAVGVVVTDKNRHTLELQCEEYEIESKKNKTKWRKTQFSNRLHYLQLIVNDIKFRNLLRVIIFGDVQGNFEQATQKAIGYAIEWQAPENYKANIYIDALAKDKRAPYRKALHQIGIRTGEIKGIARDESSALIRLADALAGAIRDSYETEHFKIAELITIAKRRGQIIIIDG